MKKIEIFVDGEYKCTTSKSKTCTQAVAGYKKAYPKVNGKVTANFKESVALDIVNRIFEGENTGGFDVPPYDVDDLDDDNLEGVTKGETIHGNPGERRVLPAGTRVGVKRASNLPADSKTKFWVFPIKGHDWPSATSQWAEDVGVGLGEEDVDVLESQSDKPLSLEEWASEYRIDDKYRAFHDEYGDACGLYSEFKQVHYEEYLEDWRMKQKDVLESQSVSKPVKKVETGEWVVKWMVDGKRDEDKTYYTDDEKDAWDTYRHLLTLLPKGEETVEKLY